MVRTILCGQSNCGLCPTPAYTYIYNIRWARPLGSRGLLLTRRFPGRRTSTYEDLDRRSRDVCHFAHEVRIGVPYDFLLSHFILVSLWPFCAFPVAYKTFFSSSITSREAIFGPFMKFLHLTDRSFVGTYIYFGSWMERLSAIICENDSAHPKKLSFVGYFP